MSGDYSDQEESDKSSVDILTGLNTNNNAKQSDRKSVDVRMSVRKNHNVCIVSLLNPGAERLAFKLRTTQPDLYGVQPSSGVLEPDCGCDVRIRTLSRKCNFKKDRFSVQTLICPNSLFTRSQLKQYWEDAEKNDVREHLLRCHLGDHCVNLASPPSSTDSAKRQCTVAKQMLPELKKLQHDFDQQEDKIEQINGSLRQVEDSIINQPAMLYTNANTAIVQYVTCFLILLAAVLYFHYNYFVEESNSHGDSFW